MTDTFTSEVELDLPSPQAVLAKVTRPRVDWVEVEGEIVAWHAETETLHLLDPIASVIFQLCDGRVPLSQTVDDLADAFHQSPADIERDVTTFAAQLREDGLIEEVS